MLAFGRIDTISNGLAHTPVTSPRNADAFFEELRRIYTTVPIAPGRNVVVAAHGNTLENHPRLFASGGELLSRQRLLETGCYVIRRDPAGALHLLQRFDDLGVLAAHTIDLDPTSPAFRPSPGPLGFEQPATGLGGMP